MKHDEPVRVVLDPSIVNSYPEDAQKKIVKMAQSEMTSDRLKAIEDAMRSDIKRAEFTRDPVKYFKSLGIDPEPIRRVGLLGDRLPWDPLTPCPPGYHKEFVTERRVITGHHTITESIDGINPSYHTFPHIEDVYIYIAVYCVRDLLPAPERLDSTDMP